MLKTYRKNYISRAGFKIRRGLGRGRDEKNGDYRLLCQHSYVDSDHDH